MPAQHTTRRAPGGKNRQLQTPWVQNMIQPRRKQPKYHKLNALVNPSDEMYHHLLQQLRKHNIAYRQRETYHGVTFYVREDHTCTAQTIHDALKFSIDPS
jgi:hypothetical protein